MKRLALGGLGLLCFVLAGCVEGEAIYTVNPDGSAKVKIDVVTGLAPTLFGFGDKGPVPKPGEESIDDMRRRAVRSTLESPGVAAWKDVSAEFLPNGKLKFAATAYLKKLDDLESKGGGIPILSPPLRFEHAEGGPLKLVALGGQDAFGPSRRKPKTAEEIKKMTDAELDQHILLDLIDLQSTKPVVVLFLADAKYKSTYILPGEVTAAEGFVRNGKSATFTLDGNKVLASYNKALNQDRAAWRKIYRQAASPAAIQAAVFDFPIETASITVAKPGAAQFDFDKEVKAARAEYPNLRKKFGFGDDLQLPTGEDPPKK